MPESRPTHHRAILLIVLAATLWSTAGLVFRLISEDDRWRIVFWRSGLLAPFLVALLLVRHGCRAGAVLCAPGWHAPLAGVFLGGAFTFWILALGGTTVANAVFLLCCQPVIAIVLGRLLLGEKLTPATMLAIPGVLVGTAIINADALEGGHLLGNLFAFATALCFSAYTITLRTRRDVDMQPAVLFAALFSTLVAALVLGGDVGISPRDFWLCLVLGIGQVGIGLVLFTAGARHLPAVELTLLSLIEVVLAPVWVWVFLGEHPGGQALLGGVVMLAAVAAPAALMLRRGPAASPGGA